MHNVKIGDDIVQRVMARRGRFHLFDCLDPKRSAFLVIDMQNTFVQPGSPAEVAASRGIVPNINTFAQELRRLGGKVVWITTAVTYTREGSEWDNFFDHFVSADVRQRTIEGLSPGHPGQKLWHELKAEEGDLHIVKNRYSAFTPGSSHLERVMRRLRIENILIGGTKTNICCESTGRDAMMIDFKAVIVSDCCAALSDREHLATLETFIQQFGDVMAKDEALAALKKGKA